LLALGPIASQIPAAVLAGILITVGIGVIDYKGLKAIPNMPKAEVAILFVVLVLSSLWNLVYAVGIGLVIASIMFMKKIGDLTSRHSAIESFDRSKAWPDELELSEQFKDEVFIKHVRGPLFFGSTSYFTQLINQIPESTNTIIIRLGRMQYIDQSGLYAMEDVLVELAKQNKKVLFTSICEQPKYMFERVDLIPKLVPKEHVFESFSDCLVHLEKDLKTNKQINYDHNKAKTAELVS
jgi:SulP family sulfate permease